MTTNRKHSSIWLHFKEDSDRKAVCNYCKTKISIISGSNGNLGRHIRRKHPTTPLTLERQPESTVSSPPALVNLETNEVESVVPSTSKQAINSQPNIAQYLQKPPPIRKVQKIDEQVLRMITKGHHSFRIVEEPEFKKLVHLVSTCPGYTLPTRKTISNNMLDNTYGKLLEEVKLNIQSGTAICLTTDGWTSMSHSSYLAVTAHFIDSNTELKTYLLACVEFNESHLAVNIANSIKDIADEFGIANKIAAVVTDNASNVVAAIRTGNWRWIGCFAHSLNLVVQTSLLKIEDILKKVKKIVEFFHRSTTALKKIV